MPVAVGGVGGVALDVLWGYLAPHLPAQLQTPWATLGAKLTAVLGGAYLINRFVPKFHKETERAAIGAGTVVTYMALRGLVQQAMPSLPLSGYVDFQSYAIPGMRGLAGYMNGYMPRTLGDITDMYSPAAVIQPAGTAVPRQFGGLSGYVAVQPHVMGSGGLMGYDWAHDGM